MKKNITLRRNGFRFLLINCCLISLFCFFSGCKKYLDEKQDTALTSPSNLDDVQGLLDNATVLNTKDWIYGEVSSDNYHLSDEQFKALPFAYIGNIYKWEENIFNPNTERSGAECWGYAYNKVYIANLALETLDKNKRTAENSKTYDDLKGQALFIRAFTFWKLATTFCKAYDATTSANDLGIPLKLNTNFNRNVQRSTVEETYQFILNDLKSAVALLPANGVVPERGSKNVVYGLLSRIYLAMHDYHNSLLNANSCLAIKSDLLDYNGRSSLPTTNDNLENLMVMEPYPSLSVNPYSIDQTFYESYSENDLRKKLFFMSNGDGTYKFGGGYGRLFFYWFTGIATDEIYLNKAECEARVGSLTTAMETLNKLAKLRYQLFVPFEANTPQDALQIILAERRKELVMRDLRWMDIKRLNKEGANIILTRVIDGQTYTLPPNDNRYALPLPNYEVTDNDWQQNPR